MPGLILPEQPLISPGARGLTHWWPLNDAFSGKSLPAAGAIYGTNAGINPAAGPPFASPNSAALFTLGGNTTISLSSAPQIGLTASSPFTISFWLWMDSLDSSDTGSAPRFVSWVSDANSNEIVVGGTTSSGGGIDFRFTLAGTVTFEKSSAAAVLKIGTWNHVVCVCDGTTGTAYLNGSSLALPNASANLVATAANWMFGGRNSGATGRRLGGRMADVRFCSGTQWTADEVAALYYSAFLPPLEMPALFVAAAAAGYTPYNPWPLAAPLLAQ